MGARVIQPCNSSNGFKPNNKSKKEISADVRGGKHANKILREVWCHLIWTKLSQLPGTKSERNSEWGGGKRKLGVCWSSLSTAGRGVMSTERDWNGLFLGLPPCPLAHIQSCIIHTLHYLSAHPSQSTTAGPSCTVPIRTFFFFFLNSRSHVLRWRMGETWSGWESQSELSQRGLQKKMAAPVVVPLISPVCHCAVVVPQDERRGRELCVMALAC